MKRFLKIFLIVVLVLLVLAQFYPRHEENNSGLSANSIQTVHTVPEEVASILETSCYDCHSNNTDYPWYSKIQPVAYWLGHHIEEGRSELNFMEFGAYKLRRQYKKLQEIVEQVKEGEMPLSSYTVIHRDAKLSNEQVATLTGWATNLIDSMKNNYPADSLVKKK